MFRFAFFLMMVFFPLQANAEVILLRSGKSMEGQIVKLNNNGFTLKMDKGSFGVSYAQIQEIQDSVGESAVNSSFVEQARAAVLQIQEKQKERLALRPQPSAPAKKIEIYIADPQARTSAAQAPSIHLPSPAGRSNQVDVYVTSWCPYCRKLIDFLHENRIVHRSYDIEKDSKANEAYRQHGGRGVPLTVVGGKKVIRGYNPNAILSAVKGL